MSDCPSTVHVTPVEGTVHGMFRNRWNPANDAPVTYCGRCAEAGQAFGFFTPSTEDPEGRALVQAIHDRKNPAEQILDASCGPTARGAWVCIPQQCNRPKGMCPERLTWELNQEG